MPSFSYPAKHWALPHAIPAGNEPVGPRELSIDTLRQFILVLYYRPGGVELEDSAGRIADGTLSWNSLSWAHVTKYLTATSTKLRALCFDSLAPWMNPKCFMSRFLLTFSSRRQSTMINLEIRNVTDMPLHSTMKTGRGLRPIMNGLVRLYSYILLR